MGVLTLLERGLLEIPEQTKRDGDTFEFSRVFNADLGNLRHEHWEEPLLLHVLD